MGILVLKSFKGPQYFYIITPEMSSNTNSCAHFIKILRKHTYTFVFIDIHSMTSHYLFTGNIYEARRQLMGLKEPAVIANIPSTYHGHSQIPGSNQPCMYDS